MFLNVKSQYIASKETLWTTEENIHLRASGRWYLSLFDLLPLAIYFNYTPCLYFIVYFVHGVFFDSLSWELNPWQGVQMTRALCTRNLRSTIQRSRYNNKAPLWLTVKEKKTSECYWQAWASRKGHRDWWYSQWFLQVTEQIVTDTGSDRWKHIPSAAAAWAQAVP